MARPTACARRSAGLPASARCCGDGAVVWVVWAPYWLQSRPLSSSLVQSRTKKVAVRCRWPPPGQNPRSPSAGRSNDRPGAPTAIAVVSSRSSEPNSVRHRQARLIHLRVRTIQADQNPSWWAATLHRVVDFPRNLFVSRSAETGIQGPFS